MTPKEQYQKAYSAIRYEYQNAWEDVEWNPKNLIDRKRRSDVELIELPSHIIGFALKAYLAEHSGYYADKLALKVAMRNYILDHFPDMTWVYYRKKETK